MNVQTYPEATAFLSAAGEALAKHEAANSLMLGICERLRTNPGWLRQPPSWHRSAVRRVCCWQR